MSKENEETTHLWLKDLKQTLSRIDSLVSAFLVKGNFQQEATHLIDMNDKR